MTSASVMILPHQRVAHHTLPRAVSVPWGGDEYQGTGGREIGERLSRGKVVQSRVQFTWLLTKRH